MKRDLLQGLLELDEKGQNTTGSYRIGKRNVGQGEVPGATMGDPTHDKGHAEKT